MVRYERSNPQGRIHCIAEYFPHSPLASSAVDHANSLDALFFAVLTGTFKGIYTDLCVDFLR
jgi:hypothetical protein